MLVYQRVDEIRLVWLFHLLSKEKRACCSNNGIYFGLHVADGTSEQLSSLLYKDTNMSATSTHLWEVNSFNL